MATFMLTMHRHLEQVFHLRLMAVVSNNAVQGSVHAYMQQCIVYMQEPLRAGALLGANGTGSLAACHGPRAVWPRFTQTLPLPNCRKLPLIL